MFGNGWTMNSQQNLPLRIAICVLALGAAIAQIFVIPRAASSYAEAYPEVAYLAAPYAAASIVAVVGIEVALLAGWQILSIAKRDESFTSSVLGWANVMAASLVFTAAVLVGVFAHASFVANIGGPAILFGLLSSTAFGAGAVVARRAVKREILFDSREQHPFVVP